MDRDDPLNSFKLFGDAIDKSLKASHSGIQFIDVDNVDLPPSSNHLFRKLLLLSFCKKNNSHVRNIVNDIVSSYHYEETKNRNKEIKKLTCNGGGLKNMILL
jgi:hypothetical protein